LRKFGDFIVFEREIKFLDMFNKKHKYGKKIFAFL